MMRGRTVNFRAQAAFQFPVVIKLRAIVRRNRFDARPLTRKANGKRRRAGKV